MITLRTLVLTTGMLALAGCNYFSDFSEIQALNNAQSGGNPFTQALTAEYKTFTNTEHKDNLDYPDALHFSRKGLAAANGDMVMPEPLSDWNLQEADIAEMAPARERLVRVFEYGAREVAPALSAKAQARFDCWVEGEEEMWKDGAKPCKQEFLDALNQLEGMVKPPAPAPEEAAPVDDLGPVEAVDMQPSGPMAPQDAMYLVFFDWDKSDLNQGAAKVLDAVAAEVKANPPAGLNIVGHADTSGPKDYNQRLAMRRATAVKDALIQRGVSAQMISIESHGEDDLLVPTPDNVREPANRRANISFR